jgi:hypothetical protein
MYRIVILSANKIVNLKNRHRQNALMRLGWWLGAHPDAYLQQAVECVDDFGNTYIISWQTVPAVRGY